MNKPNSVPDDSQLEKEILNLIKRYDCYISNPPYNNSEAVIKEMARDVYQEYESYIKTHYVLRQQIIEGIEKAAKEIKKESYCYESDLLDIEQVTREAILGEKD